MSASRASDTMLAVGSPARPGRRADFRDRAGHGRTISIGSRGSQLHGGRAASQITGMIQAGTAINPGNSGAPVNDIGLVATKSAARLLDKGHRPCSRAPSR
jgi:S1-C subfamily serine protease